MSKPTLLIPRRDGGDDWPGLIDALREGPVSLIRDGVYRCKSRQAYPDESILIGAPGVRIISELTARGLANSFDGSPFWSDGGSNVANTTTLSAVAAIGATTISVASAAGLSVGSLIYLVKGTAYIRAREIKAIAGTTVTIDEPLGRAFAIGDGVRVVRGTRDITIHGNGMTIEGTGDAAFELIAAWRCRIEDVHIKGSAWTLYQAAYDVAARDCHWIRCSADGEGVVSVGFANDFAERVHMVDCNARRHVLAGVSHNSADDCTITRGYLSGVTGGLGGAWLVDVVAAVADAGTRGLRGYNVNISKCAGAGVLVQNGAQDVQLIGAQIAACQSGVSLSGGIAAATDFRMIGGRIHDCTVQAIGTQQASQGKSYGTVITGAVNTADTSTFVQA